MVCSCPKRSKCIGLIYLIGFDPIDILYMRSQCPHSSPERALQLVKNATSIPKCVTMKWDNGGRGWGKTVDEIPAKRRKQKNKTGMYNKLGNRMITHFLNWVTTNLGDSQYVPMVDALVSGVQNQLTYLSLTILFFSTSSSSC